MQSVTPTPSPNPIEADPEYLLETSHTVITVVHTTWAFTILIGVVGNALLCLTIGFNPSLHTAMNTYVFSIGVVDLVTCACLLPLRIAVENKAWQGLDVPINVYETELFLRALTDVGRLLLMQSLTFERYQAIAYPLAVTKVQARRRARVVILIQSLLSLLVASLAIRYFCDSSLYDHCRIRTTQFPNYSHGNNHITSNNITTNVTNSAAKNSTPVSTTVIASREIKVLSPDWGLLETYVELPLTLASVTIIFSCYTLILSISRQQKRKLSNHSKVKKNQVSPAINQECPNKVNKTQTEPSFDSKMEMKASPKKEIIQPKRSVPRQNVKNHQCTSLFSLQEPKQDAIFSLPRTHSLPDNRKNIQFDKSGVSGVDFNSQPIILVSEKDLRNTEAENERNNVLSLCEADGLKEINGLKETEEDNKPVSNNPECVKIPGKESQDKPFISIKDKSWSSTDLYSRRVSSPEFPVTQEMDCLECPENNSTDIEFRTKTCENDRRNSLSNTGIDVSCTENKREDSIRTNNVKDIEHESTIASSSQSPKRQTVKVLGESKTLDVLDVSLLQKSENVRPYNDLTEPLHDEVGSINRNNIPKDIGGETEIKGKDERCASATVEKSDNISEIKINPSSAEKQVQVFEIDGSVNVRNIPASIAPNTNSIDGAVCLMTKSNRVIGRRRLELKAALKVGFLFVCFVCLWMPMPVSISIVRRQNSFITDNRAINMTVVFSALATFTAAIDPVVYGLLNGKIRESMLEHGKKIRRRLQTYLSNLH